MEISFLMRAIKKERVEGWRRVKEKEEWTNKLAFSFFFSFF